MNVFGNEFVFMEASSVWRHGLLKLSEFRFGLIGILLRSFFARLSDGLVTSLI
jgi:hypothetical protein